MSLIRTCVGVTVATLVLRTDADNGPRFHLTLLCAHATYWSLLLLVGVTNARHRAVPTPGGLNQCIWDRSIINHWQAQLSLVLRIIHYPNGVNPHKKKSSSCFICILKSNTLSAPVYAHL
jgi:hypothetical protein